MLIGAAPANTPFIVNGRITDPWLAWLNTITSTGAVVDVLDTDTLRASFNLSDVANAGTARTNLGLGSASTHAVTDFDAAGAATTAAAAAQAAAIAASDPVGSAAAVLASSLQRASNLSDLANAGTARTNLGLGTAATQASTAFDAAGAASAVSAASCQRGSNLSDLANAATARTNLGLGSGLSVTVALAKITPTTGTNGSLTFVNGILTAKVDPT